MACSESNVIIQSLSTMRISRNCELLAGTVVRTLFVKAAEMQSIFRLDVSFTPIPIIWCLVKSCEDGILVTCLEHCENSAAAALELHRVRTEMFPKMKGGLGALNLHVCIARRNVFGTRLRIQDSTLERGRLRCGNLLAIAVESVFIRACFAQV
jgi:hypothetical protein